MISVLSGYGDGIGGLGIQQVTPPFTFEGLVIGDAFRCSPGTVPAVSPSGEVTGCRATSLVDAPGMATGLPSWVPWVIGLGALAIFIGTVWK